MQQQQQVMVHCSKKNEIIQNSTTSIEVGLEVTSFGTYLALGLKLTRGSKISCQHTLNHQIVVQNKPPLAEA
jgi:hypothetical protein